MTVSPGRWPLGHAHSQIVAAMLDALPHQDAQVLHRQLATAHVVGGLPTLLELAVDPATPGVNYPDGRLPVTALVTGKDGQPSGEILVWINGGQLSGLEYAWVTDDPPGQWPDLDQLRVSLDPDR